MAKRITNSTDRALTAQEILRPLYRRLEVVGGGDRNSSPLWMMDPVWHALTAILEKCLSPRAEELHHSSKLYRAIDDIENTALLMPKYQSSAQELRSIASELRRISGWRVGE